MKKLYMIFILFYLTGCSDFLKEYSQDLAYVQGYEDLDELLIGNGYFAVYATNSWESTGATGLQYYPWVHLSGDELQQIVVSDWDEEGAAWATYGFFTWQYRLYEDPDGNTTWIENNDFQKLYSHINACNMILEETKAFENKNDETIYENLKRIKGECYFLRGSCYFLLANFYGKPYDVNTADKEPAIPLKLSNYIEDVYFQRNSVSEVYKQVEKDFLEAERLLKDIPKKSTYRADVHATRLMLSRMYLYMCDYENAMKYASLVIEEGPVLADLNSFTGDVFLTPDLSELIFSMGGNALSGNVSMALYPCSGNYYQISNELYAAYMPETSHDLRLQYYVGIEDGVLQYKKLQNRRYSMADLSDVFLLRTSEAYLNLAEAATCVGEESIAKTALKALREKRIDQTYYDPSELDDLTGKNLVDFVREERRRELCLEGHRWFDLRRYRVAIQYPEEFTLEHTFTHKIYNEFLDIYETAWVRKFILPSDDPAWVLPIPEEEIEKNPGMINNPRNERSYENINN